MELAHAVQNVALIAHRKVRIYGGFRRKIRYHKIYAPVFYAVAQNLN